MIPSDSFESLQNIKYTLNTLGCNPIIVPIFNQHGLVLSHSDVIELSKIGFVTGNAGINYGIDIDMVLDKICVTNIKHLDQREDTYCFTEPKRQMGIFNGVITGNCAEILEVSSATEYAVCNLASICLPKFVEYAADGLPFFNYQKLYEVVKVATRNLDNIIDINFYPVDKAKVSNLKHRPIGIGVQGLADVFAKYRTPFDSDTARELNKKIFETIYYGFLVESHQLALERGSYSTFEGSPISQGILQFDMWGLTAADLSGMWDFDDIRQKIQMGGIRNSLGTTAMPTASTSQINGNTECIEPVTANIYSRSTLAGNFYVVNSYLMKDLMELGLWDNGMIDMIKYHEGSIQQIPIIPEEIKLRYRTVWELPIKSLIDMSADRGPFIDQTQSFNVFIAEPNFVKLTTCLFYGWRKSLKTLMYYLRSKPASEANKFGIDIDKIKDIESKMNETDLSQTNGEDLDQTNGENLDHMQKSIDELANDLDLEIEMEQNANIRFDFSDDTPKCRNEEGCLVCGS